MRTDDLDFELPEALIAQSPAERREASRLLHYRRADGAMVDRVFSALPDLLRAGDLLVFNDSRVLPARVLLRKATGGLVEGLWLAETRPGAWHMMLRNVGPTRAGLQLIFENAPDLSLLIESQDADGTYHVRVSTDEPAAAVLPRVGRMPLPPYIRREKGTDPRDEMDRERYQTVYARWAGSVAAPTAGLHFTEPVLSALAEKGVERTFVTLHVGMGTFKPVSVDDLADHQMHREQYEISEEAALAMNRAKRDGRRIIAVGTTATRVIESQPGGNAIEAHAGSTAIFIRPPYEWRHVSALVTNFHLPRSTLVALVAAFTGLDEQRMLYSHAITERYRFFSYGDSMLLE